MSSTPNPAGPFRNVATWLRVGQGATSIVYVTQSGGHATATWTPAGDHDEFGVPIGGADSPVKGTLVGERYSRALFQQGVQQGLFPLAPTYVVSDRDDDLLKLVDVNGQAAWDALVLPVLETNGIIADPGHVERNAPEGLGGGAQTPPAPQPSTPAGGSTPSAGGAAIEIDLPPGFTSVVDSTSPRLVIRIVPG